MKRQRRQTQRRLQHVLVSQGGWRRYRDGWPGFSERHRSRDAGRGVGRREKRGCCGCSSSGCLDGIPPTHGLLQPSACAEPRSQLLALSDKQSQPLYSAQSSKQTPRGSWRPRPHRGLQRGWCHPAPARGHDSRRGTESSSWAAGKHEPRGRRRGRASLQEGMRQRCWNDPGSLGGATPRPPAPRVGRRSPPIWISSLGLFWTILPLF